MPTISDTAWRVARNVSIPGGPAKHFRVQYRESVCNDWRMFASFRLRDQAEECLTALQQQGHDVRLVECGRCPAAG